MRNSIQIKSESICLCVSAENVSSKQWLSSHRCKVSIISCHFPAEMLKSSSAVSGHPVGEIVLPHWTAPTQQLIKIHPHVLQHIFSPDSAPLCCDLLPASSVQRWWCGSLPCWCENCESPRAKLLVNRSDETRSHEINSAAGTFEAIRRKQRCRNNRWKEI